MKNLKIIHIYTSMQVFEKIREEMGRQKVSQADICRKTGMDAGQLCNALKGRVNFTLAQVLQLQEILGCDLVASDKPLVGPQIDPIFDGLLDNDNFKAMAVAFDFYLSSKKGGRIDAGHEIIAHEVEQLLRIMAQYHDYFGVKNAQMGHGHIDGNTKGNKPHKKQRTGSSA